MIYDETGKEIKHPDLTTGWIETVKTVKKHHEAQPMKTEIVTDGGVQKSVVVSYPQDAYDEFEEKKVYHPFSPEQLADLNQPTQEERLTACEDLLMEMLGGGI